MNENLCKRSLKEKIMKRTLSEEKVLKKLGIADFRHLSKDKIMKFASMLPQMDPEVAKKALEQFPEFAKTAKDVLVEYRNILEKELESDSKSTARYYDACDNIIKSLQDELKQEDLDAEQKRDIMNKMIEVADMMGKKDAEHKKFLLGIAAMASTTVVAVVAALGAALGGNARIESSDEDTKD